jgi:hypothetical protein
MHAGGICLLHGYGTVTPVPQHASLVENTLGSTVYRNQMKERDDNMIWVDQSESAPEQKRSSDIGDLCAPLCLHAGLSFLVQGYLHPI